MIRVLLIAAILTGCGATSGDVKRARRSAYNTSFARVWSVVSDEVAKRNSALTVDSAARGIIETEWKLVERRESDDINAANEVYVGGVYLRYKVRIKRGGPPWRVSVDAEAAAYRPGLAMLQPFTHGSADEPTYVRGRIEALEVAIHKRLEGYAVESHESASGEPVTLDVSPWPGLPPAAAQVVAMTHDAAKRRDATALRAIMAKEFRWSLGGERSSEQALGVYAADPDLLRVLEKILVAGCGEDPTTHTIACPAGSVEEGEGARAGFQEIGGVWRMTWFLGAR